MKAVGFAAALALCAGALGQVVDGVVDGVYGPPIVIQNTQTSFGDNNVGHPRWANGSELDAAYGIVSTGSLFLMLAGNLESNFNKLEVFIDINPGTGQSTLRADNPDVDFNGLNRMAGMTFPAGFSPDFWISSTGGDIGGGTYGYFVNYAELLTGGGGAGYFVGGNDGSGSPLGGGTNPFGLAAAIDNSNTGGVGGGTGTDPGNGAFVLTGMEFLIPLAAIGSPTDDIRVMVMINGGGHDFLSNQVLGGLNGGDHLGDPRNVDFRNTRASFFTVPIPAPGAAALLGLALVASRRRRA